MLGSNIFFKKPKIAIRFNLPKVCPSVSPFVFAALFTSSFNVLLLFLFFYSVRWRFPMFDFDKFRRVYLNGVKNKSSSKGLKFNRQPLKKVICHHQP